MKDSYLFVLEYWSDFVAKHCMYKPVLGKLIDRGGLAMNLFLIFVKGWLSKDLLNQDKSSPLCSFPALVKWDHW